MNSCQEKKVWPNVDVNFIEPATSVYYKVPDSINIYIEVTSAKTIKFVKISIDDGQHNSITEDSYFYPNAMEASIETTVLIHSIPQSQPGPYHIHVAVDDGEQLSHEVLKIQLLDADVVADGFYVFTEGELGKTEILKFGMDFSDSLVTQISGNYLNAIQQPKRQQLVVATKDVGRVNGFSTVDNSLQWSLQADMPKPIYTSFMMDTDLLYLGTANGRVTGIDATNGLQRMTTSTAVDSLPLSIGVANNFIVVDYMAVQGGQHSWYTYYKGTGSRFQRHPSNYHALKFFQTEGANQLLVFCNQNNKGVVGQYHIETNNFQAAQHFDSLFIDVEKQNSNAYFVAAAHSVMEYRLTNESFKEVIQTQARIVDLVYDDVSQLLYVAQDHHINIYRISDFHMLKSIQINEEVKGICLSHLYNVEVN